MLPQALSGLLLQYWARSFEHQGSEPSDHPGSLLFHGSCLERKSHPQQQASAAGQCPGLDPGEHGDLPQCYQNLAFLQYCDDQ